METETIVNDPLRLRLPRSFSGASRIRVVRLLLVDRFNNAVFTRKRERDYWEIGISGRLERGESPRTGARREVMEELGLYVEPAFLVDYSIADRSLCIRAFIALGDSTKPLKVSSELAEACWLPVSIISSYKLLKEHLVLLGYGLSYLGSIGFGSQPAFSVSDSRFVNTFEGCQFWNGR